MNQAFINVVIPFAARYSQRVNEVLRALTDGKSGNRPSVSIEQTLTSIGIVHFMSITVVEPVCPSEQDWSRQEEPGSGESHLLIEMSADGGTAEALAMVGDRLGPELWRILRAAELKPAPKETLGAYLLRHQKVIGASWHSQALGQIFSGSPGMTARRICKEELLAARIGALIDEWRTDAHWQQLSPRQRLDRVRNRIWEDGDTKWAFVAEPAPLLVGDPNAKIPASKLVLAGWSIVNTLLWPLYVPLLLIFALVFAITWEHEGLKVAILWTGGVAIVAFFLFAIIAGLLYAWLRRKESTDGEDDQTPPSVQVEALMKVENFSAQNHLASVSRLKGGWLRRLTLRIAFIVVGTGRIVGAPGFLGKNGVIHFARWMRLGDQLLFLSNFDNTWESYVADFIADAPSGVTAIWSNCAGFPKTASLYKGGAARRDRLVRWARRQQHPTLFWYSAYPDLTAERIRVNAAIRQGIASATSDDDARDWLALFGSKPRPASALQIPEIPTLVFGGLSSLRYGACHAIALNDDVARCREWLNAAAADASYGETQPGQESAIVVALSASGLKKLGVGEAALKTFPVPFQQGMWPEWRARELGDIAGSAPAGWRWGNGAPEMTVDVLLLVYGLTAGLRETAWNKLKEQAERLGHNMVHSLVLAPVSKRAAGAAVDPRRPEFPHEPFGFADGISQPIIRGAPRATDASPNHIVAAGEIVLGYPDNTGEVPPSPTIPDHDDPGHLLPDSGIDPFRKRPEFSRYEADGRRDLGANGTFLVVRQLQQDMAKFDEWQERAVDQLRAEAVVAKEQDSIAILSGEEVQEPLLVSEPTRHRQSKLTPIDWTPGSGDRRRIKDAIAAKLIGRWKDGTSLVRNPQLPGTEQDPPADPDNEFLPGAEDPSGLACPFGSHIRRANPRDTRFPGTRDEVDSTNRHRILRVGRAYLDPNQPDKLEKPNEPVGLLFMCLNADIERQFEFIQKTWLLNPNVHGLENEVDPVMGRGYRHFTLATPTGPIRLEIGEGFDFVTMMGGGYFFLPGRATLRYLASPL
jgi:deferrochelatase/peroxidase EfeB